jgi:hypothetical protein
VSLQSSIRSAFDTLPTELFESVTYIETADPIAYDATTGAITDTTTSRPVRALFESFSRREIDGTLVQPQDLKAIITSAQFGTYTPKLSDKITRQNGRTWSIVAIQSLEPVPDTAFIFQIRRP